MNDDDINQSQSDNAHSQSEDQSNQDPSDKLTPEHPRFKEVIQKNHELAATIEDLKGQLEEVKNGIAARQNESGDDDITPEEQAAIDKIAKGLIKRGYVATPEDLSSDRKARDYERLSNKYDGKGEYPKFEPVAVEVFAKQRGITNLEDAYFSVHKAAIIQIEAKKQAKIVEVPDSERPGKSSMPQSAEGKPLTPEDIENMSNEDYEANRTAILASLKPKASPY